MKVEPFYYIYLRIFHMCDQCRSRSAGTSIPPDQDLHCLLFWSELTNKSKSICIMIWIYTVNTCDKMHIYRLEKATANFRGLGFTPTSGGGIVMYICTVDSVVNDLL
jgi:hypothetical protein